MRRLCTIDQFAKLGDQERDADVGISISSTDIPEFGESGRLVRYVFSTPAVARDLHTVSANAWQLDNFARNPVFLWAHDDTLPPIGRVTDIGDENGKLKGWVEYAERELNPFADTIYQLVRARYLNAVSTSWMPLEWSFSRDKSRPGGVDFTKVDLLEISQVPLPAHPAALAEARSHGIDTGPMYDWAERLLDHGGMIPVPRDELEILRRAAKMPAPKTARSIESAQWKIGASKDLSIEDSEGWDSAQAEASIFEYAGGDKFDPAKARRGFLIVNESASEKRESYQIPIARAVAGELKISKGAISAALSRLAQGDLPTEAKESARVLLDHYAEKIAAAKDGSGDEAKAKRTVTVRAPRSLRFNRGLYECAQLAYLLANLSGIHSHSEYEEAIEEDEDSELPKLLGEAMHSVADAFLAMTQEEVEELLASVSDDGEEIPEGERAFVARATTPRQRAWRRGIAFLRAGKSLSASNAEKLSDADAHCERALKHHRGLAEHHAAVQGHVEDLRSIQKRATSTLAELGYDDPKINRCMREMSEKTDDVADRHADAVDSHNMMGRSVKSAQRCMRGVLESSTPAAEEPKTTEQDSRAARLARAQKLKAVT